jgi:predicted AAA+ superfamily ATPase
VTLVDSGLACHLAGVDADRLLGEPRLLGGLAEGFVAHELVRAAAMSHTDPVIHHYRSHGGREVDLVLEASDGRVVALEVKVASTVDDRDLAGLVHLRDTLGDRFVAGAVLHLTDRPSPAGERMYRLPIAALWT